MYKYLWPIVTGGLALLAEVMLMILPFAMHVNHGGAWRTATYLDFWSGIGMIVITLIMTGAWLWALRAELIRRGIISRPEPAASRKPAPGQGSASFEESRGRSDAEWDELLRPLAEAVLLDLSEQLNHKESRQREEVEL
ncbi:MAG: hypothetical protein M1294_11325 [Firmicutes bacterium]|jgi:hypothetical protein|uniref:Uncharacterized protein n=1 Tax=Sulfobacillus benefaciens TaxID=453960 RepID=A0A2T2WV49_9FIRM|nr:hypothetical protein [Bacillota bacterium]MCL5012696.1 hypothetical protein [Bacillota bacterium]PSR26102.1 MAG: hypothetical protein C7B43_14925 [Sulfobacillus benefaciens]HBQ95887.1 hypothetical protein [Sulfobacillus sp.]